MNAETGWTPVSMVLALLSADGGKGLTPEEWADGLVASIAPLIEADLRERLAAAIEAERSPVGPSGYELGLDDGLRIAARIVRGVASMSGAV